MKNVKKCFRKFLVSKIVEVFDLSHKLKVARPQFSGSRWPQIRPPRSLHTVKDDISILMFIFVPKFEIG